MAFLTFVLVVITGFYAWATFQILKANKDVVAIMSEQNEAISRPYVSISANQQPDINIFVLRIVNTGKTPAKKLRLSFDKDYFKYAEKNDESNLSKFVAFQEEIESFPPSAEMHFDLAQGFKIFGTEEEKQNSSALFTITAKYSYGNKTVTEKNTIDLRPYFMSNCPDDPYVYQIKRLRESLEKTGDKINKTLVQKI